MLYELPNGKTVDIPIEIYLLSDEKFQEYVNILLSENAGFVTENFFHDSANMTEDKDDDGFLDDDILLIRDDI